jgi:hypothetical protein
MTTMTSLDTLKELIANGRALSPDESRELISGLTREDVTAMTPEEYLRIYPKELRPRDHRTMASIADLETTTLSRLFPELDEFVDACVGWLGTEEEDGNRIESSFASLPAVVRITAWCRVGRWLVDHDDGHATYHRKVHRHLSGLILEALGETRRDDEVW